MPTPYQSTGQQKDFSTGLAYLNARSYDRLADLGSRASPNDTSKPQLGQFLSHDICVVNESADLRDGRIKGKLRQSAYPVNPHSYSVYTGMASPSPMAIWAVQWRPTYDPQLGQ